MNRVYRNPLAIFAATGILLGAGIVPGGGLAADSELWLNASWMGITWSTAKYWTLSQPAGEGGMATVSAYVTTLNQNVSGLTLSGLKFTAAVNNGMTFNGQSVNMVGDRPALTFQRKDSTGPNFTAKVVGESGQTLVRNGQGTVRLNTPVEGFDRVVFADGTTYATSGTDGASVLSSSPLTPAGGAVVYAPSAEGQAVSATIPGGVDLSAGMGVGRLTVTKGNATSATLTIPSISRSGNGAAVILNTSGGAATLGVTEKFAVTSPSLLTCGIFDPAVVVRGESDPSCPFSFTTYDATKGIVPFPDASAKDFGIAGMNDVAIVSPAAYDTVSVTEDKHVGALIVENNANLSIASGKTLTVGDGTHPAGIIFREQNTAKDQSHLFQGNGTLSFGNSHGVVWFGSPIQNGWGANRQLAWNTRTSGAAGMTFAGDTLAGSRTYPLLWLSNGKLDHSGDTYFYGLRVSPQTAGSFPVGKGDVHILGGLGGLGAQFFPSASGTFSQNFHFSGVGNSTTPQNENLDGYGVVSLDEKAITFTGRVVLEDDSHFVASATGGAVFSGAITGPGWLRLYGGSWEYRSAGNAYSGGTEVTGGATLTLRDEATPGCGPLTVPNGCVKFVNCTNTLAGTVSNAQKIEFQRAQVSLSADYAADNTRVGQDVKLMPAGTMDLGSVSQVGSAEIASASASATVSVGGSGDSAFSAAMSGSLGFVKKGSGTLSLYGNQSYTGPTTIAGGTLKLENDLLKSADVVYWLDADEADTIETANGRVTKWRSRNGNGVSFTPPTLGDMVFVGPTQTKVGDHQMLTFTAADNTRLAGDGEYVQRTVFMALRPTGTPNFAGPFGRSGYDCGIRMTGTSPQWGNLDAGYHFASRNYLWQNGVMQTANPAPAFALNDTQVLTIIHHHDFDSNGYSSLAGFVPSIGGYAPAKSPNNYEGEIGEVIVFNRILTTDERQEVENYLSQKWRGAPFYPGVAKHACTGNILPEGTQLTVAAGATLDLNGLDQTVASLSGWGRIVNTADTPAVLHVGTAGDFAGTVGEGVTLVFDDADDADLSLTVEEDATVSCEGGSIALAPYNPGVPRSGLLYHLDASLKDSVIVDQDGAVVQWKSQGGTMGDFVWNDALGYGMAKGATYSESGLSGRPGVHFGNSNSLVSENAGSVRTLFFVKRCDGNQANVYGVWGQYGVDCGFRYSNTLVLDLGNSTVCYRTKGETLHINGQDLTGTLSYNDSTTETMVFSCRVAANNVNIGEARSAINKYCNGNGGINWFGEVIAYSRALSDAEMASVEAYLTNKWKTSPSIPPRNEVMVEDGGNLAFGSGVAVSGDVTLGGTFVFDVKDGTRFDPVVFSGNVSIADGTVAEVRNYQSLDGSTSHQLMRVEGTAQGDFAKPTLRRWIMSKTGACWNLFRKGLLLVVE